MCEELESIGVAHISWILVRSRGFPVCWYPCHISYALNETVHQSHPEWASPNIDWMMTIFTGTMHLCKLVEKNSANKRWHRLRYKTEWKLNMICKLKLQWQSHIRTLATLTRPFLFYSTVPSPELFIQSLQFPVLCETLSLSLQQSFLSLVFALHLRTSRCQAKDLSLFEIMILLEKRLIHPGLLIHAVRSKDEWVLIPVLMVLTWIILLNF